MRLLSTFLIAVSTLFALSVATPVVYAAEEQKELTAEEQLALRRAEIEEERKANRKKIARRFPGYRKHGKAFKALCDAIALDGRNYFFRQVGQANNVKREDCQACKELYKQFAKSCRPKTTKKKRKNKDESEGEVKVPKKQLEPHVITVQRASEIGYTLKRDKRWMHAHYVALTDFEKRLETDEYTYGERRYAKLVLESILEHFADHRRKLEKVERKRNESMQGLSFIERDKLLEARELEEIIEENE